MPLPVLIISPPLALALEVAVQDDQSVPPEATPPTIGTSVMLSVRKRTSQVAGKSAMSGSVAASRHSLRLVKVPTSTTPAKAMDEEARAIKLAGMR